MSDYQDYRKSLEARLWRYAKNSVPDSHREAGHPPPVFTRESADENVLTDPDADDAVKQRVLRAIPPGKRHKWFRSMTSSQALAQSVFGNLRAYARLDLLQGLCGDDGHPLFIRGAATCCLEHEVKGLEEPQPTSVDVFFAGEHQVAVECKLAEREIGPCSRPWWPKSTCRCDGAYVVRPESECPDRCPLTAKRIRYWELIPELFEWRNDEDHQCCPLSSTYQLVRNVLAACLGPGGGIDARRGRAVLLYDERNPEFQPSGKGRKAWETVKCALKDPSLLQQCTWQQVTACLRADPELAWLTDGLCSKYGL